MAKSRIARTIALSGMALFACSMASAAPAGTRDPSFGNGDGLVLTTFSPFNASAEAIVQQPDGDLVVAGYVDKTAPATDEKNLILIRYNGFTGSRDLTFGDQGVAEISYAKGIRASALVRQSNEGFLAAGWVHRNLFSDELAVTRITKNGKLDTAFGNEGITTIGVGNDNTRAFGIAESFNGSIWVAGYTSSAGTNAEDFMLVRLRSDGKLDTSFSQGGGLLTDIGGGTDKAFSLLKQSDGKLLLVGESSVFVNGVRSKDFALVRYTVDGKLDGTFSSDGKQTTFFSSGDDAVATKALQQKDGKIVVVGSCAAAGGGDRDIAVARYFSNGTLDPSFGGDGAVLTDFGGNDDVATGIIQQWDDKLLVSGSSSNGDAVLVRYKTNGMLDTDFGIGGRVTVSASVPFIMTSLVKQADGQVVAAGLSYDINTGRSVVALLRYLFNDDDDDGVVDSTDNCQFVPNAGQTNSDTDEDGDACDDDDDNDGVKDANDAFPLDPTETRDNDGDGIGDNADPDDDNDGVLDGEDPFPFDAFLLNRLTGDGAGDRAGYSVATVGDVDGDGFADMLVGAPKNDVILPGKTNASANVGSVYLVSGKTVGGVQKIIKQFDGAAKGDEFGAVVAAVGDINNDAVPDFAIAAPKADQVDSLSGKVLVKDSGAVTFYSGESAVLPAVSYPPLFTLKGEAAGDGFGSAVAGAGDVNSDNYGDLVVGAWKVDGLDSLTQKPIKDIGAAYLYSGQTALNSNQIAAQIHRFVGESKGDYFGYSVAVGSDLDRDAVSEVSVGAYKHDPVDSLTNKLRIDAGVVYVYRLLAPSYTLVKKIPGSAKGDYFGFAQASINNGQDGFVDLLVGSPKADVVTDKKRADAGQVTLFVDATGVPAYAAHAASPQAGANFGAAVSIAGDVNGVGGPDVVVGAPKTDVKTPQGKTLTDAGRVSTHRADTGAQVFAYDGRYKAGQAGFAVAGGDDHNNDTFDDILSGSPFAAFNGKAKAGVAEVISGKEASAVALAPP